MKKVFFLALALFLFGCSSKKLDGTYTSSWNERSFTFSPDGTAFESVKGVKVGETLPYSIDGDTVKVAIFQFKLLQDGTIDGGAAYGKLTKNEK